MQVRTVHNIFRNQKRILQVFQDITFEDTHSVLENQISRLNSQEMMH